MAQIVDRPERATNPGILVDALARRHGLVEETQKLVDLIDITVSRDLMDICLAAN